MIGYTKTTKVWRLWDSQPKGGAGRVIICSDVIFDEAKITGRRLPSLPDTTVLETLLPEESADILEDVYPSE
jgi:hypothetical protein